jgi:hypothetical protein
MRVVALFDPKIKGVVPELGNSRAIPMFDADYGFDREQLSADATVTVRLFATRTTETALFSFDQESSLRLLRQWSHSLDD